jgi:MFS family permease
VKANVYKKYLLGVLLVILAANYVDGLALGLVLQNIKADLSLSDTQLGVLSGIAFALFYSVAGIPIARWADNGNRVKIISLTAVAWSVMVALCGFAGNFVQLLLIRIGVGVGEAGCIPPAHSLIADQFTRAERPRAMAIYLQGNSLSLVIGYFLAGWLNEWYGWRVTFMLLATPGLAISALAWLTLREPRLAKSPPNTVEQNTLLFPSRTDLEAVSSPPVPLRQVCVALWSNRTFRQLLLAFAVAYFFSNGIAQWQPAFFARSYGLNTGQLGSWFALIYGLGGMLGIYLGGEWATRRAANDECRQLRAMAVLYCGYGVASTLTYLSSSHYFAFCFMAIAAVLGAMTTGPLFATLQTLVPSRMRAISIALVFLVGNLIGLGLGPLATGALSDALHPVFGEESLRYALLTLCPGFLWVAWHLWGASRTVLSDLEAVRSTDQRMQRESSSTAGVSLVDKPHITCALSVPPANQHVIGEGRRSWMI